MAVASDTTDDVPSGRSFKDFAHLFLSTASQPKQARAPENDRPPQPRPPSQIPPKPPEPEIPGRTSRLVTFLDGGEGWLRSFLVAELALLLGRQQGRVRVCEEGGLFPTVSSHLGRVLGRDPHRWPIAIGQGIPGEEVLCSGGLVLLEIPSGLPPWALPWLERADLRVLVAGKGQMSRLRTFQQWKRIPKFPGSHPTGLVLAEPPGSGQARLAFHRFLATAPESKRSELLFLGALPLEPALERIILPERKPAQVFFPGSLTAAALAGLAAALRRTLTPEPVGP